MALGLLGAVLAALLKKHTPELALLLAVAVCGAAVLAAVRGVREVWAFLEDLLAAAKAKGVKFGRPPIPLPDNFYLVHKAWRAKKLTLKQAAAACGMPVGTFYCKAVKFENTT